MKKFKSLKINWTESSTLREGAEYLNFDLAEIAIYSAAVSHSLWAERQIVKLKAENPYYSLKDHYNPMHTYDKSRLHSDLGSCLMGKSSPMRGESTSMERRILC